MRKIALLTIHCANSYGGMLQAFATQTILSKYGNVSIIDYKTEHLNKTMKLFRYGLLPRDFLRMGKDLTRIIPRYKLLKNFKNFTSKNFNLTKLCKNNNDLESLEKDFDYFVCGSDQIWNPNIILKFDDAYFLNFVTKKKKISYASSCGSYKFNKDEEAKLIGFFKTFSSISSREKNTANYISNILGDNKEIYDVLDPTLMMNKKEWLNALEIKSEIPKEKYLLVYTLKKDDFLRSTINYISKKFNLKIIVIDQDPYLGYHSDEHIKDACPNRYIKLFSEASFVITNSFHGTAFATNFEVPFIVIKPESGLNRVENYLNNIGLQDRLILDNNFENKINDKIDFENSTKKLNELRIKSYEFLDSAFK